MRGGDARGMHGGGMRGLVPNGRMHERDARGMCERYAPGSVLSCYIVARVQERSSFEDHIFDFQLMILFRGPRF